MDTGDLRKQILHALDAARKDAAEKRKAADDAARAYETFLTATAVPLVQQAAQVLTAEKQRFVCETPAGRVRLVAENDPDTFLELQLDTAGASPRVLGRLSLARGRGRVAVEERPLADKPVAELGEQDVAAFLVTDVPRLVMR